MILYWRLYTGEDFTVFAVWLMVGIFTFSSFTYAIGTVWLLQIFTTLYICIVDMHGTTIRIIEQNLALYMAD